MTGPEHYQRAQEILAKLTDVTADAGLSVEVAIIWATQAHAHATLALVAATAPPSRDWHKAQTGDEDLPKPKPLELS